MEGRIRQALARANPMVFTIVAGLAGFCAYFSMYAFRKPFTAATFDARRRAGTSPSTTRSPSSSPRSPATPLSKLIGVKVISEISPARRGVGDPGPDRRLLAGAGRLRPDPRAVERRGAVPQRPAARHDLGPGVRLHGGPARVRGAGRHPLRQLHPLVRRREIGRRLADGRGPCRPVLDAGGHRRAVLSAAVRLGLGAGPAAAAQRRGRGRAGPARADERGRARRLPEGLCARHHPAGGRLCVADRLPGLPRQLRRRDLDRAGLRQGGRNLHGQRTAGRGHIAAGARRGDDGARQSTGADGDPWHRVRGLCPARRLDPGLPGRTCWRPCLG